MPDTSPLVTVYIPCRNYGRFLSQAIESVCQQLYHNWELLVIDEASDDESRAIADQYANRHPNRIRTVAHDTPRGLQKLANQVLGMANGKYIVRLDADDWLDEGALLLMVAKLESNPDYGLVYGNYYYTDEAGKILGVEQRRKLGTEDISGHTPPHGACTMVRTRALKAAGGYEEDINAQDGWDLWLKLINRVKSAHLDAPLFYYRQHGSSLSRDAERLLNARKAIFSKARERLDGSYIPTCLAVVPVRESYPDWEGVPYQAFGDKSLLECALESATRALGVTDTMVTSQSQSVLDFAAGVERDRGLKHMRVLRDGTSNSGPIRPQEILMHAQEAYRKERATAPDIVLFLSVHAPRRLPAHVDSAIDILRTTMSDSVVSVTQELEPMFCHGKDGLTLLNPGRFDGLAFDKEHLYRFNGAIIGVWGEILQHNLFGNSIAYLEMAQSDSLQVKSAADAVDPASAQPSR